MSTTSRRKKLERPCPGCGQVDLAEQYKKPGGIIPIECEACGFSTHYTTDEIVQSHAQLMGQNQPDPREVQRETHNVGSRRGPGDPGDDDAVGGDSD